MSLRALAEAAETMEASWSRDTPMNSPYEDQAYGPLPSGGYGRMTGITPNGEDDDDDDDGELKVNPTELSTSIFVIISVLVLITIVFEWVSERLVETASKFMKPIVQSLFSELTVLGFLSLVTFSISESGGLEDLSEHLYGDSEEGRGFLQELLEKVHYLLFLVMILFICKAYLLIRVGNAAEQRWASWNKMAQDERKMEDCRALLRENKSDSFWNWEANAARHEAMHVLEFASLRREFIHGRQPFPPHDPLPEDDRLPENFDYARYQAINLGMLISELVDLPPATWFVLWIFCIVIYCVSLLVDGDNVKLGLCWAAIGYIDFFGMIVFFHKITQIQVSLVNPRDIRVSGVLEEETGHEGLTSLDRPEWTQREPEDTDRSWIVRMLAGDNPPNKHLQLFWMEHLGPALNIFLFRLHLVCQSVYMSLVFLDFAPTMSENYGLVTALVYVGVALLPTFLLGMLYTSSLVSRMSHISCVGMLRKASVIQEVIRQQKTGRAVKVLLLLNRMAMTDMDDDGGSIESTDLDKYRDEIGEIEHAFDLYDKDNSGAVDLEEFRDMMGGLGHVFDEVQCEQMFNSLDEDGNGTVSKEEFVYWHIRRAHRRQSSDIREMAQHLFNMLDDDQSGSITVTEFKAGLDKLNAGLSVDEIVDLVRDLDQDGDGCIDLEEFVELLERFADT